MCICVHRDRIVRKQLGRDATRTVSSPAQKDPPTCSLDSRSCDINTTDQNGLGKSIVLRAIEYYRQRRTSGLVAAGYHTTHTSQQVAGIVNRSMWHHSIARLIRPGNSEQPNDKAGSTNHSDPPKSKAKTKDDLSLFSVAVDRQKGILQVEATRYDSAAA